MRASRLLFTLGLAAALLAPAGARARVLCGSCPDRDPPCGSSAGCDGVREGTACGGAGSVAACIGVLGDGLSVASCASGTDRIICCECREAETTFTEFDEPFIIDEDNPDEQFFTLTLPFDPAPIEDVIIQVELQHTRIGDLSLRLIHDGVSVMLMDRPGVTGQDLGCDADLGCAEPLYFQDAGVVPIQCAGQCGSCFPTGMVASDLYVPKDALAALVGHDPSGSWTLAVQDHAQGETGAICGWGVTAAIAQSTPTKTSSWGLLKTMYR